MRARAIVLLLFLVPACAPSRPAFEAEYDRTRQSIWRGDFAEAKTRAEAVEAQAGGHPAWEWRFRMLIGEIAILQRDFPSAERVIHAQLPAGPAFDGLRAHQQLLDAKLQVELGHFQIAHDRLTQARAHAGADPDLALDVDRLDGQALLRLGEWDHGETLLNAVVTKAAARSDRYHQATALNDPRDEPPGSQPLRRGAARKLERVMAMPDLSEWSVYALSSRNAGSCYQRLGRVRSGRCARSSARSRCRNAVASAGNRFVQALGELGNLYARLRGEPERALPYLQRGLAEARAANVTAEIPRLAGNVASVEVDLHRWDDAERDNGEAQRAWMATHAAPSVYHVLTSARIAVGRDQFDEAVRILAAVVAAPTNPPSVMWDAHFTLANIALTRRQPARAAAEFESALTIIETTRAGLLRTDDKVSYLTRLISFYQTYVSALIARGQTDRALEVADSSRGQVLAERQRTSPPARVKAAAFQRAARGVGHGDAVMLAHCRTDWRGSGSSLLAPCICCPCRLPARSTPWCASISRPSRTRWPTCSARTARPAIGSTRGLSSPRPSGSRRMLASSSCRTACCMKSTSRP